ncbi:D-glycero-beta-D-manno-heptose-7-phosphate kinase [Niveibacterium sp. SC-1]|uniref:D-glycero-beta-D-manno-heptose-7-phosphate kinase n=1 Tax=Niveibacterium sp. SC-1 TaxID=3135646 RepID=UPI00311D2BD1
MKLPDFTQYKLVVAGDVMLDRYWFGDVSRISPEAPVPVVKIERQEERSGGAANVARNIATLGGRTSLLTVVGNDDAGRRLHSLLKQDDIEPSLHIDSQIDTTVKLRVIGRQQQLLRIDFETTPSDEVLSAKLRDFARRVADVDVVVLSDYDKGGLRQVREMIRIAKEAGKPVLVDPKGNDFSKYEGATLITPNRAELRQVVGSWASEEELARKALGLRNALGLDAVLVTRSEEGMSLYGDGETVHQRAVARDVFDVTGAGDTVIATMALMYAAGADWTSAMRVASEAAGIVVGRLGTAAVDREELEQALA